MKNHTFILKNLQRSGVQQTNAKIRVETTKTITSIHLFERAAISPPKRQQATKIHNSLSSFLPLQKPTSHLFGSKHDSFSINTCQLNRIEINMKHLYALQQHRLQLYSSFSWKKQSTFCRKRKIRLFKLNHPMDGKQYIKPPYYKTEQGTAHAYK